MSETQTAPETKSVPDFSANRLSLPSNNVPMALPDEPPALFDRPEIQKKLTLGAIALVVLVFLSGFLVSKQPHFGIDGIPGFYSWFGFLAPIGIVIAAKLWGLVARRNEGFYDEPDQDGGTKA
ncbi:MAG: hypothetical protein ACPGOY_05700 [Rhodospirillaceae bacterium]